MIFNTSFSFGPSTLNPKREAGIIYLSRTACSAYGLEEWLMRYKSEETMDRIVKSVERFFFAHHRSPSITEIANDIGCSRSTIHAYLREMNQLGRLHYDGKTLETSVTQKADAEFTLSPVLGSISCGLPEYAEENFEEYVALPTALFGSGRILPSPRKWKFHDRSGNRTRRSGGCPKTENSGRRRYRGGTGRE